MKRFLLAVVTGVLMLNAGTIRTNAQVPQPLAFFKNYFITGDYVVGGVGLTGSGRGDILIEGVPAGTDIAAAFLYWQVVDKGNLGPDAGGMGATFRGHPLSSVNGPFGKLLGGGTPACSSGGGGANGANLTYSYRADVLRYLDVDPQGGKLSANGLHSVTLPNGQSLEALGASLVVVFRDPTAPLTAIVLYDGAHTMSQTTGEMRQSIQGFYDANGTSARLTHIVSSGQSNTSETLRYNDTILAVDPFNSSRSAQWDNPTYSVVADPTLDTVTTSVDHAGFSSYGCFTWSGIIYSTPVKDFDGDGLLDRWEASTEDILDPYGRALPNLEAMGADWRVKDVFIEVGYMHTDGNADGVPDPLSYGGVAKPGHSHLPGHQALKLMGDAFAGKAYIEGTPNATPRINVHFDVGPDYPPGDLLDLSKNAEAYLVRDEAAPRRTLARGGEAVNETVTQCAPGANVWECQFSQYPGTVGWKSGFRFLRDEVLNPVPVPAGQDDPCDAPGATCERRFDRNRTHMFRYALFAHALGLPESEKACLVNGVNGSVEADDVNGSCASIGVDNPAFHKPRTNTGIADFPGSDILVTLGGFNDLLGQPVGTPFMQASTLMHEFGHNAERRHGGEALEQNCKPNYLSVMNYTYQLRGLLDDFGTPHVDFSGAIRAEVDEASLSRPRPYQLGSDQPYRLGWYAPLAGSYLAGRSTPARRHCNGSDLLPTDVPMVRIDARTSGGLIDWDANGIAGQTRGLAQDVNFNGRFDGRAPFAPLGGSDDWSNLRLNQIGSRRNVGGIFVDPVTGATVVGPLSLDSGKGDLGKGDLGKGDLGKGDLGKGDLGKGDLGKGDLGKGDLGKGDLGKGDLGGGDLFLNDPNNPSGELDATTAGDLGKAAPIEFAACVTGEAGCQATGPLHDVYVAFGAPNEGNAAFFTVYRVDGAELTFAAAGQPQQTWTTVAVINSVLGREAYSTFDDDELVDRALYTYFVVATYLDGVRSDPSNLVTITAVNTPPMPVGDTYPTSEDTVLEVAAPGVLANDDPDSPLTAQVVTGPSSGTLTLNANGSFIYRPAANYHGQDSFTYRAINGAAALGATATVTITVNAVNDAPTATADSYTVAEDGTLNVGAPGLLAGDTDIDGDALTAVLVGGVSHGTLSFSNNGAFTYAPAANYNGPDSFTYADNDGTVNGNTVTVSLVVTPVNDPPTAVADSYSTAEDTALTVGAPGVLGNDSDPESTTLTALLVSGTSHGALSLSANGSFSYTPALNYNGIDTFTYTVNDGVAESAEGTVTITVTAVNDPPVAIGDSATTQEDTPVLVSVLGNDTDIDGGTLTALVASGPTKGTLTPGVAGVFTYTPAPNSNGSDSFTYTVNDGTVNGNTVTVSLLVTPVNDPPAAVADSYSTAEDTALIVAAAGVLGNDSDIEGSALSAVLVTGTNNGALSLNANGSFSYTPALNYSGPDAFTYKANDGTVDSNVVTVALTVTSVNDPPTAVANSYSTAEDTALIVAAAGVLGNDSDLEGAVLTALLVSGTSHGALSLNANGSFSYTPALNYSGSDAFTYKANDGTVDSNVVTVAITVTAVNDPPTAVANSYSTAEDTALIVAAAAGVLGNDSDPEGAVLTALLVSGTSHGALSLNANGSFSYTPALNYSGPDAFTYKANDGTVDSNVVAVAITVTAVNDSPTISDIVDRTINWNTNTGEMTFTIGDGDGLTSASVTGASSNTTLVPSANIVFAGSGANRTVTVTPAIDQIGSAVITVTVQDASGLQASDTFLLTVQRTFVGLQNIPPPAGKTFKTGSAIPLSWRYQNGTTVVNSSMARFEVNVVGPLPNPSVTNTDSGQSSFRYSDGVWSFNLQTKNASGTAFPVGTYQVTVRSLTAGYASSAPFMITLVK